MNCLPSLKLHKPFPNAVILDNEIVFLNEKKYHLIHMYIVILSLFVTINSYCIDSKKRNDGKIRICKTEDKFSFVYKLTFLECA